MHKQHIYFFNEFYDFYISASFLNTDIFDLVTTPKKKKYSFAQAFTWGNKQKTYCQNLPHQFMWHT